MPKSPSRKTTDLEIAIADASCGSGLGVSPTRKARAQAGRIILTIADGGACLFHSRAGVLTIDASGPCW
jgi:hypothetical protein